jgi:High potential iron-sulfur protein
MTRRKVLLSLMTLGGLITLLPRQGVAERRRGGADSGKGAATGGAAALVDPKAPEVKAVSYVHAHKDLKDKTLQTERSGVKWVDQKCSNCVFYDPKGEVTVGAVKAGPCSMPFAKGKVVARDGWCTSWAKRS